ncbi:MAG: hypothetical protein ABIU84_03570 [Thermoanaerobaculia bacterium]
MPTRLSLGTAIALISTLFALVLLVAPAPALAVKRRAFATSATGSGDLNSWPEADGLFGTAAADRICRNLAGTAGLANANTYRAWISSASTDAYCHVQGMTGKRSTGCSGAPQAAGPWFVLFASGNFTGTLDELTGPDGVIFRGVLQDEQGFFLDPPSIGTYWTGTSRTGEVRPDTCSSWVVGEAGVFATVGEVRASAKHWSDRGTLSNCNSTRRLLCLEPGTSEPPAPTPWAPAAIAFVTRAAGNSSWANWVGGLNGETGVAAADVLCRNQATTAHLPSPESFVAWLSTSTLDAKDRLTLANARYRRIDGYVVADSKADLVDGSNDNSLHVDQNGDYLIGSLGVFTGTGADGTHSGSSCADWTNGLLPSVTAGHAAQMRSDDWTVGPVQECNSSNHVYCFANVVTIFWDGFDLTEDAARWSAVAP